MTSASLIVWGMKSVYSLADQALTSGASFAVNLLLARWLPGEAYGAFAVAFAAYLFVTGFHIVLLLEPLSVMGPSRHSANLESYFIEQIKLHILLTGILSLTALLGGLILWKFAPGSPLISAILGAAITLPALLFLWLTRRMCYVVQRPKIAVIGSACYLTFVLAGLLLFQRLGHLNAFTGFLLMGGGSLLAGLILAWLLRLNRTDGSQRSVSWRKVWLENWSYGRWLAGGTVLSSVSSQMQTFLVAALLGLSSAGVFRAVQIPMLVMTQVVFAIGPVILPAFSYDFGRGAVLGIRRKALLVSLGLGTVALCFVALMAMFATPVEHVLFGGKYNAYAGLIWVLALIPVAQGFSLGFSMALRASQTPHFDLIANAIAAPVAVISAIVLIRWLGLKGAALSLVAGYATYSVVTIYVYFFRGSNPTQLTEMQKCGNIS
ncbi:MAG TPA: oligosaccharide flippase family protein [Candidatus Acidoferrales bacterium]|nr:oligosaccharide flippase family protein [Candidatus Acidoferrales bacterium]